VADFQGEYGLNLYDMGLDGAETTPDVLRAAVLCAQLPPTCRVARAETPDAAWGVESQLLRVLEYDLQCVLYALSKRGAKKPEPLPLPSERAAREIDEGVVERSKAEVDAVLGMLDPNE
jgi:hypothetical protein